MDIETGRKLVVGYGGTLGYYYPARKQTNRFFRRLGHWFWTYRNIDEEGASYTSPYYLFMGLARFRKMHPDQAGLIQVNLWGLIDQRNAELIDKLELSNMVKIEGYLSKSESLDKI